FQRRYIRSLDTLYFNVAIETPTQPGVYEHVPGYATIKSSGIVNNSQGWLELKTVGIRDNDSGERINPVAKAAFNFSRIHLSDQIYPAQNLAANGTPLSIIKGLAGFAMDIKTTLKGFNKTLRSQGWGTRTLPAQSWIRLHNPTKMKTGGGCRVQSIVYSDNWNQMVGGNANTESFGQFYDYTKEDPLLGTISTGVASWEPLLGGDENPFRLPRTQQKRNLLAPDEKYVLEEPFGEFAYPSPSVVYEKVQVRDLKETSVKRNDTGYTEYGFYTAKDFPTSSYETPIKVKSPHVAPVLKFLKINLIDYTTASQGYAVVLNDMHGKPRYTYVYAADKTEPISGTEYHYRINGGQFREGQFNVLNNKDVRVIKSDGSEVQAQIGVEVELALDTRQSGTNTLGIKNRANIDAFLALFLPVPVISFIPKPVVSRSRFRSIVSTKIIRKYGLLDKVVAFDRDGGAKITTENLAWDGETGEVLLTRTTNEFLDPVYNFSYPAHWAYDRMGPAYKNIRTTIGFLDPNNASDLALNTLVKGDELMIDDGSTMKKGWVYAVDVPNKDIHIINQSGQTLAPSSATFQSVTVIRSGRRNLQAASVGSIVSKADPMDGTGLVDASKDILSAGAVEYSDQRNTFCGDPYLACPPGIGNSSQTNISWNYEPDDEVNPFRLGLSGFWYPKKSYAFLTDRTPAAQTPGGQPDIRYDGKYTGFNAFWQPPGSGEFWTPQSTGWTWTEEESKFSPHGYAVESKNAIDVYSSAQYGYNYELPVAMAGNARYSDFAAENFEAFSASPSQGQPRHIVFKRKDDLTLELESDHVHSGKQSVMVRAQEFAYAAHPIQYQAATAVGGGATTYVLKDLDCLGIFAPEILNPVRYVVSVWVKGEEYEEGQVVLDYPDREIEVLQACSIIPLEKTRRSVLIDGWQRLEAEFYLNPNSNPDVAGIEVRLKNGSSGKKAWFDDFRIHPFESQMTTYAYDPITRRLLATGDENNFMTFYQYDQKGQLISVKVETEDGIRSIQEGRYNTTSINN
ncbi:MAG: hypothetical protein AAF206_25350, partial [Bacteroidota bacterium]